MEPLTWAKFSLGLFGTKGEMIRSWRGHSHSLFPQLPKEKNEKDK